MFDVCPPDLGSPTFPPTGGLGMCAVGVAAKVIAGSDGEPDWSNIWGRGSASTSTKAKTTMRPPTA